MVSHSCSVLSGRRRPLGPVCGSRPPALVLPRAFRDALVGARHPPKHALQTGDEPHHTPCRRPTQAGRPCAPQRQTRPERTAIRRWKRRPPERVRECWKRNPRRYPERYLVRRASRGLRELGLLDVGDRCADCGGGPVELHHPDYRDPFHVVPLCRRCHLRRHYAEWRRAGEVPGGVWPDVGHGGVSRGTGSPRQLAGAAQAPQRVCGRRGRSGHGRRGCCCSSSMQSILSTPHILCPPRYVVRRGGAPGDQVRHAGDLRVNGAILGRATAFDSGGDFRIIRRLLAGVAFGS